MSVTTGSGNGTPPTQRVEPVGNHQRYRKNPSLQRFGRTRLPSPPELTSQREPNQ